ncbi:putative carbonic anhydrase-like protein 1 isoform X2 [Limulus polyphemus]|uniref:Carbonic anhydrase-like protein 1 isoform X2 n=1 Tax=Limulus polyphemus TaxID=6850 RepID=A0ABM1SB62_LIMPO|nr:putative carbonic anhydrase-like protein 1 isoform X2 [Limulus polyphemus]
MAVLSLLLAVQGVLILLQFQVSLGSWEEWWTYDGISGPNYWGLLNPEWSLCNMGHRQSPVDIDPSKLLFDPHLRPLHVEKERINGIITNTGHGIVFKANSSTKASAVHINSGPLSYDYRVAEVHLHFGSTEKFGSEHTVAGQTFPAEVQILGYNADLYKNISEAVTKSQGIVGIALLIQMGVETNLEFRLLTSQLNKVLYKGQQAVLNSFSVRELLPDTHFYTTYEGSLTMPGCHETVTWLVMNKPIYITKQQLYALKQSMQGERDNPKAPLVNNFRPTQATHHRLLRTNIDFNRHKNQQCPTMYKNMFYKVVSVQ